MVPEMNRPPFNGVLVAFEGIDGAGKTTQATLLADSLRAIGLDVVSSKEPTTGPHGQRLRESAWAGRLEPAEELEMFIADRREHVAGLILPSLQAGKIVILDRYYFSTAAYQGIRGLDWEAIIARNETFAPQPDVLFMLDIEPALGVGRVNERDGRANQFEKLGDLEKARLIFRQLSRPYLKRLDGTRSKEELLGSEMKSVMQRLMDRISVRTDLSTKEKLHATMDSGAAWAGTTASIL